MDLDAVQIANSLPEFAEDIVGVVPQFGGKVFDITLRNVDAATRLATAGFDYENSSKPLRLLGARTIHVSIFVSVEFPDIDILQFLKQYGQLKSDNLRRLYYSDEGLHHIERGIRVAEFAVLERDLPRKIVTQGLEIYFKYTGQPVQCYRCNSSEHTVKDCPKKRRRPPPVRDLVAETGGEGLPPPPPANNDSEDMETQASSPDSEPSTAPSTGTSSTTTASGEPSYAAVTQELLPDSQASDNHRKRPPSSPAKADNSMPIKRATNTAAVNTARKQLHPSAEPEHSPADPAFLRNFTTALKKPGAQRTKLMGVLTGSQYYHCRGLYLQHIYGNHADADTQLRQKLGERENQEWSELHRTLSADAHAKLLRLCEELRRERPALFTTR